MSSRFAEPDYQLQWPRALFKKEASTLLNRRNLRDWDDRCALLLEHAFVGGRQGNLQSEFNDLVEGNTTAVTPTSPSAYPGSVLTVQQQFLRELLVNSDQLVEHGQHHRPYWSERRGSVQNSAKGDLRSVIRSFVSLVTEFDRDGYFDRFFGTDCEDDPRGETVDRLFEQELGAEDLWPLTRGRLLIDGELLFDVIEFLHDNVARPNTRSFHSWNGCGWHYSAFDIEAGRVAYRWRTNQILERFKVGLRLAEEGEDIGRLVAVTDDARMDLVETITTREEGEATEQVRHAVALFRQRGADRNQKRSAINALALILEERRYNVLTEALANSDRGALFDIANNYHIRHQRADQKRDYDDFYLDWIFWVYLASIELTNRIIDEQDATSASV
jgi:hypothetical protein